VIFACFKEDLLRICDKNFNLAKIEMMWLTNCFLSVLAKTNSCEWHLPKCMLSQIWTELFWVSFTNFTKLCLGLLLLNYSQKQEAYGANIYAAWFIHFKTVNGMCLIWFFNLHHLKNSLLICWTDKQKTSYCCDGMWGPKPH